MSNHFLYTLLFHTKKLLYQKTKNYTIGQLEKYTVSVRKNYNPKNSVNLYVKLGEHGFSL